MGQVFEGLLITAVVEEDIIGRLLGCLDGVTSTVYVQLSMARPPGVMEALVVLGHVVLSSLLAFVSVGGIGGLHPRHRQKRPWRQTVAVV